MTTQPTWDDLPPATPGFDRVFGQRDPAKPLNESLDPLELEPATPPTIKPYPLADEGNTPD